MIKVDLITGFLGSGKTTFIKEYAKFLMKQGEKICILENDFGAINVDMLMLQELLCDQCDLEMIAGGCDSDCHKRRFKTKMISMGMRGFTRVIIEPSGIYDIDEFFDTLREEPLDNWYEIDNVITVVDAGITEELTETSRYLLATQAAFSGKIVFTKTDKIKEMLVEEQLHQKIEYMNTCLVEIKSNRKISMADCTSDYQNWTEEHWKKLIQSGYRTSAFVKHDLESEGDYQSLYFMEERIPCEQLEELAERLFADDLTGTVLRVKGFAKNADGKWVQFNFTKSEYAMDMVSKGQDVFIVIGEQLAESRIREILQNHKRMG